MMTAKEKQELLPKIQVRFDPNDKEILVRFVGMFEDKFMSRREVRELFNNLSDDERKPIGKRKSIPESLAEGMSLKEYVRETSLPMSFKYNVLITMLGAFASTLGFLDPKGEEDRIKFIKKKVEEGQDLRLEYSRRKREIDEKHQKELDTVMNWHKKERELLKQKQEEEEQQIIKAVIAKSQVPS